MGLSVGQYRAAVKEMIQKMYLVLVEGRKNLYRFYEYPQKDCETYGSTLMGHNSEDYVGESEGISDENSEGQMNDLEGLFAENEMNQTDDVERVIDEKTVGHTQKIERLPAEKDDISSSNPESNDADFAGEIQQNITDTTKNTTSDTTRNITERRLPTYYDYLERNESRSWIGKEQSMRH